MTDPAERFIQAAAAPLGDNAEVQVAAEVALRQAISGEVDEEAGAGLVESDRSPVTRRWRPVLTAVAFLGFGLMLAASLNYIATVKPLVDLLGTLAGAPTSGSSNYDPEAQLTKDVEEKDRLLLIGDPSRPSPSLRWKALWDSQPENPAYFANYAAAHVYEHKDVPPDFLKIAGEIDPGNAWFPAIAAAVLSSQSTREIPRSDEEKASKSPKRHAVTDPAKHSEAMLLFRQAARMERFDSYQEALTVQRIRLLPPRTDWVDQAPPIIYMASQRSAMESVRHLVAGISAESGRLSSTHDRAGLEALVTDWEAFVRLYAPSPDAILIDSLLKFVVVRAGYRSIGSATSGMGLEPVGTRLAAINMSFDEHRRRSKALEANRGNFKDRASLYAGLLLPTVSGRTVEAPEIHDEDLKPGRLGEHEFLGKVMAATLAVSLGLLMVFLAAYRFRGGTLVRRLSARLVFLLRASDWIWVLGAGVILPFLAFSLVIRLPMLGAREWSIVASDFVSPCSPWGLYLWLAILLPVLIARWRLGKRVGFIGLKWRPSRFAWVLAVLLILAIPFAPQATLPWHLSTSVALGFVVLGHAAGWWACVTTMRGLFSTREHLLKRVALSRVVLPAYAVALVLMSLSVIAGHALECHWIQRDRLTEVSAEEPGVNRYEHRVSQAMQRELLKILDSP